ncbi:TWiK family of potassium channels protein 7 [Aphelenchoides bicaudatus]|nr:TWiK family of potassium channels protein 7 [Aphelenchoides bicaudatus]
MSRQVGTSEFSRRSSRKHSSGRKRRYQQHLTPNYQPPTDESIQDEESIRPLLSQNSGADDFAHRQSIGQSSTSPHPNGLDQTENDVSAVEKDSDFELEQYELDDRIGEMPPSFTRRQRREGLFTPPRHMRSETPWEANDLLASNHLQKSLNDEYLSDAGSRNMMMDEEMAQSSNLKKYAKLILPHIGLVLLTITYTVLGAFLFFMIENPNEKQSKRYQLDMIYKRQENFVETLLELAGRNELNQTVWKTVADEHLHNLSDHFFIAYEKIFLTAEEVKRNSPIEIWTFSTAIFFSVTVVTTIGKKLILVNVEMRRERREHVCINCQHSGLSPNAQIIEENKIPSLVVFAILVLYTALGGVLMSHLETWSFSTSFYWSFISLTTVGFGDLMPRRDRYMYLILFYIVLGLAITTMQVGVQYIRKIHYFGRKIQDARSALAVVGGKVVLVSELYANLMQKRARNSARDAFVIENLYVSKHVIPFIPSDIRWIKFIDQADQMSRSNSTSSLELHSSCRFCHSRFSVSNSQLTS